MLHGVLHNQECCNVAHSVVVSKCCTKCCTMHNYECCPPATRAITRHPLQSLHWNTKSFLQMFFFSFPSKKQFAAGSKKARVFLLNYFVTKFVFCNRFPFSCRGKCRITREIIKSLISHQLLRHQTYLPLLIAFSLEVISDPFHWRLKNLSWIVVARTERKVFGKMPLIVCLLSAATQWALL